MTEITNDDRCRGCRRRRTTNPCHGCWWACVRKIDYSTRESAKEAVAELRQNMWDDPTLHAYLCRVAGDHYHVGHTVGREARRLSKRAEKFRRRTLSPNTVGQETE